MPKEEILGGALQGAILGTVSAGVMIAFWDAHRFGLPGVMRDGGDLMALMLSFSSVVTGSVVGAIISGCSSRFFSSAEQPRQRVGDFPLEGWMRSMEKDEQDDKSQAKMVAFKAS